MTRKQQVVSPRAQATLWYAAVIAAGPVIAVPAGAQTVARTPYLAVDVGVAAPSDLAYRYAGLDHYFLTKYDRGPDLAVAAGYDFGGLRVEAAGHVATARARQFGFNILNQPEGVATGAAVAGSIRMVTGLVNVYYDVRPAARLSPFVGAGAGITRFTSSGVGYAGVGASGIYIDNSDYTLAMQATAGVRARIGERLSARLSYRYATGRGVDVRIFDSIGETSVRSSSITIGLSYAFRGPPPPPPPLPVVRREPVAPASPDPMTATAAQVGYIVTFAPRSATVDAGAGQVLDQVVESHRAAGYASIMIMGRGDWSVPGVYDDELARHRAVKVRDGLVDRGAPRHDIAIEQFDPLDPLARQVGPPLSPAHGAIDITFGPGSGQ